MKISERLAKWAYAWNVIFDRNPYFNPGVGAAFRPYPERINLCNLFWRTFGLTPLLLLGGLGLGTLLLVGLRAIALEALLFVLAAGGLSALFIGLSLLIPESWGTKILDASDAISAKVSPVFGAIGRAKKEVCPYFEVDDGK